MRILISGASGFIGQAACRCLSETGHEVIGVVRSRQSILPQGITRLEVGEIDGNTDWGGSLSKIDAVVHLAARVHIMCDPAVDPLSEFRRINVAGTINLARRGIEAGIRRFIFLSTIKVNGARTFLNQPYTADDMPDPIDLYGLSKLEAERELGNLAHETGLEVVIIRPPLVYGPGVKANFLSLMRCLCKGIPLPLGSIHNKRSLVALDNLVDLIVTCIRHPAAANQIFLAGDGEDFSTTELLKRLGKYLDKPARLIPVPQKLLEAGFKLVGRDDLAHRLCGSLQVDISRARELLGWTPPVSADEALANTAQHFLQFQSR